MWYVCDVCIYMFVYCICVYMWHACVHGHGVRVVCGVCPYAMRVCVCDVDLCNVPSLMCECVLRVCMHLYVFWVLCICVSHPHMHTSYTYAIPHNIPIHIELALAKHTMHRHAYDVHRCIPPHAQHTYASIHATHTSHGHNSPLHI